MVHLGVRVYSLSRVSGVWGEDHNFDDVIGSWLIDRQGQHWQCDKIISLRCPATLKITTPFVHKIGIELMFASHSRYGAAGRFALLQHA